MKRLLVIALVLVGCENRNSNEEKTTEPNIYWQQRIETGIDDDSPSCDHLMTLVWVNNNIARTWLDNTCGLTDSIVLLRQKEASSLVNTLKQIKLNP